MTQLNNPIKIDSVSALCAYLDGLSAKNKVRVCFRNYVQWREFLSYSEKYKTKFAQFKEKKDFIMNSNLVITKQENILLKDSLIDWMKKNNIDSKIQEVLLNEVK